MKPYDTKHFRVGIADPDPDPANKAYRVEFTINLIKGSFNFWWPTYVPDTVDKDKILDYAKASLAELLAAIDEEVASASSPNDP